MEEYYNNNPDFKIFVDKYCKKHCLTVEEALQHEVVKQVYLQYSGETET